MPEATDAELIEAVLGGSGSAFGLLMDRYEERVFRLLSRFTRDRGEVEDLAQEVFVKVFRKLHTFQQDAGFFTWVYRIAVNTANDHFSRRSRRQLRLVGEDTLLDQGGLDREHEDAPSRPAEDEELRAITRRIVDQLPEKYRTILVLREFEDLSYTEMSEVLGCSIGTVESRLFRARQRFKEALERSHPELVPGGRVERRVGSALGSRPTEGGR